MKLIITFCAGKLLCQENDYKTILLDKKKKNIYIDFISDNNDYKLLSFCSN